MLALRGQGWSYTALAEKYECPKLTIRFLARKYGLDGNTVIVQFTRQDYLKTITIALPPATIIQTTSSEEKVSEGKTYAQYVKDEKERRWKHLIQSKS